MKPRKPIGKRLIGEQKKAHEEWKKGFLERSKKRRKNSVLFEGGPGQAPVSLLNAAAKRAYLKREAKFIGVEFKGFNEEEILARTGLKRLPKNLDLQKGSAIDALFLMPPNSVKAVRGINLTNCLVGQTSNSPFQVMPAGEAFFAASKRALVPGGFLFLTNDMYNGLWLSLTAHAFGFKSFLRHELTVTECRKSLDASVRRRATTEGRMELITQWFGENYLENEMVQKSVVPLLKLGVIKSIDDLARPVSYIFRKPYTHEDIQRIQRARTK